MGRPSLAAGHLEDGKDAMPQQVRSIAVMLPEAGYDIVSGEVILGARMRRPDVAGICITTLGQFRVLLRSSPAGAVRPVVWSTAQARQLLKCLLTSHGYQRAREELIELLWAEQAVDRARAALSHALTHLRRTLEPGRSAYSRSAFLGSDRDTVWLNVASPEAMPGDEAAGGAGLWLDVAHFEHNARAALTIFERAEQEGQAVSRYGAQLAEQALTLYAGPFLPGDPFADWAAGVRERTLRLWVALVRRLAGHFGAAGNLERASLLLGQLVDAMPDNEDAATRLMLLYAATNQRSLALRVYYVLCAQLQATFGAKPAPDLQQLAQDIRSGTLAGDPLALLRQLS